jgi:hypothetical protein
MWKAFVFGAVVAGAIGPIALLIFGTAARQDSPPARLPVAARRLRISSMRLPHFQSVRS